MANAVDCSSIVLNGITMDCQGSMGGIKSVWIARYQDLADITVAPVSASDDRDGEITNITLKADAEWKKYDFRKETGSLTSEQVIDETTGVNYFNNNLSLVFTKMETAKRVELTALSVGQVICIVLDSNGKYWFLGKDDYVSATAGGAQTGVAKGDQNAYTLTLSTASETYPYEIAKASAEKIVNNQPVTG